MNDESHTGRCMCGALRYAVRGAPIRIGVCHCKTCRRTTGAAFGIFAIFGRDDLFITSGATAWFQSSPAGRRHFRRDCGSPIFSEWNDSDDIDIFVGTLDWPQLFWPTYELWRVRRLPWLWRLGRLVQFARDRT